MKTIPTRTLILLSAFALPLAACGGNEATSEETTANLEQRDATVTDTINDEPQFASLSRLMSQAGLAQTFDGAGDYTILAPDEGAFAATADALGDMADKEALPIRLSVLRDHILPGSLDPDAIAAAISSTGGPVEMQTMGDTTITFSQQADGLVATGEDGMEVALGRPAVIATNGVVIPVSGFLKSFAAPQ